MILAYVAIALVTFVGLLLVEAKQSKSVDDMQIFWVFGASAFWPGALILAFIVGATEGLKQTSFWLTHRGPDHRDLA